MSTGVARDAAVWESLRQKHWDHVRSAHAADGRIAFDCGIGWAGLIDDVFTTAGQLLAGTDERLRVWQVKEKLGGLRVACEALPLIAAAPVSRAIERAEFLSFATCEACGAPGRLMSDNGWWLTRCPAHAPPGAKPHRR
jgi:hypothetical protein